MKPTPFPQLLHTFFHEWLEQQRNVSHHTVVSYRDSWRLFLRFVAAQKTKPVAKLGLSDLTEVEVLAFLQHLEQARKSSIGTRNCRLSALHSFFSFVADREPLAAAQCAAVLRIPTKQAPRPEVHDLDEDVITAILAQPNRSKLEGQRDSTLGARNRSSFAPRMLSDEELRRFFQGVDTLKPTARSPLRHLVMPEIFRLLYGCGFRVSEVLKLRVRDVNLNQGIITVRQGKFRKDRLVPPALPLVNRLRKYAAQFENRSPDAIFFPGPSGGPFSLYTVYRLFRQLLLQGGISHGGRGKGPRIHDARHQFACCVLRRWYQDGADLDAQLPLLATYLGHVNLSGTQRYLHLTAELFPEITARADAAFGDVIPRRIER